MYSKLRANLFKASTDFCGSEHARHPSYNAAFTLFTIAGGLKLPVDKTKQHKA